MLFLESAGQQENIPLPGVGYFCKRCWSRRFHWLQTQYKLYRSSWLPPELRTYCWKYDTSWLQHREDKTPTGSSKNWPWPLPFHAQLLSTSGFLVRAHNHFHLCIEWGSTKSQRIVPNPWLHRQPLLICRSKSKRNGHESRKGFAEGWMTGLGETAGRIIYITPMWKLWRNNFSE